MIELLITFDETTGAINATGPLQNEPLAFWLLDKAKDIIKAYNVKPAPKLTPFSSLGALASVKENGHH